ncbi:MAG: tetratricopeptide repeat protein, partial [Acidobacteriota bacterium]
ELLYDLKALKAGSGSTMSRPLPRPSGPSVAVLPFVNMTSDPDQDYFCDGMAEELITALSRIKGLAVAARTSSFQFKGQAPDIRHIGDRLRVQTVLEGSVRKLGNRLRIAAQLVNVTDGYQLWSERFDRTFDDVFAIQDDIASAIATALAVTLGDARPEKAVKPPTEHLEAYHLFLRGRYLSYQLGNVAASLMGALDCFSKAAALDPNFAAAQAGVADSYIMLGYYTILPSTQAAEQGRAAAQRAVDLDPDLADGYSALGWAKTVFGLDLSTAEADLRRALALNPNHVPARCYLGVYLFAVGRFDESIAALQDCLSRDPSFLVARFSLCHAYVAARRFDEAWREIKFLQELAPDWPGIRWYLALVLGGRDQHREAVEIAAEGTRLAQGAPLFAGQQALMHARAGDHAEAEALLASLAASGYASAYLLALVHGALGRLDQGFALLHQAIDDHNDNVSLMAVDWRFDVFRRDPRFPSLLARLRLPLHPIHG